MVPGDRQWRQVPNTIQQWQLVIATTSTKEEPPTTYLCMPDNPQYSTYVPGVQGPSYIYGVEYRLHQAGLPIPPNRHYHNVPCAVCHVQQRGSLLMIPARKDCPTSWTKEYEGALMSEHVNTTTPCSNVWIERRNLFLGVLQLQV